MERESFEDNEVARVLNRDFVSVKVDREERPDIDSIYMSVCQALNGHGGWPMTIIMTPGGKPFFAGTYFPKYSRMGLPGLMTILKRISEAWKNDRQALLDTADAIMAAVSGRNTPTASASTRASASRSSAERILAEHEEKHAILDKLINMAFGQYKNSFDDIFGGFGQAPKFPSPHIFLFLLRYWKLTGNETTLKMTEKSLDCMRRGGIFDHIGFGFCRYSTDRAWLVPHFEKMLYDNALLAIAYLETFQATGNRKYAGTAEEIFTYILRDMTSPEGGFYSAEDADSEDETGLREEGRFYTWTPDEVRAALGNGNSNEAEWVMDMLDITDKGNFDGRSIPNIIRQDTEKSIFGSAGINDDADTNDSAGTVDKAGIPDTNKELWEACRQKLFEYRDRRPHPFKDDKILTSWNGLMIAAMAIGGRVLGNSRYTAAAEKAADFILRNLVDENSRLLAVYREGTARLKAYAEDYAFLVWGLLELYETTYKTKYLKEAVRLNRQMLELFWDGENGGLYLYGNDGEQLILRPKEGYDGAVPSANSQAAHNMIRLARLTGSYELEEKALRIIDAFSGSISDYPAGFSHMLGAAIMLKAQGNEVIITGSSDTGADELLNVLREGYRPFTVSIYINSEQARADLFELVPFAANYPAAGGKAAAYVCRGFTCDNPVTDPEKLRELLHS
ncbi:MAG: thioredoxin domain-containing protein [Bacillota bacterium]